MVVKTTSLSLLRHGPKNNSVEAHQTGVEALLNPAKIGEIKDHARGIYMNRKFAVLCGKDHVVKIYTTPIERAKATGRIVFEELRKYIETGDVRSDFQKIFSGVSEQGDLKNLSDYEKRLIENGGEVLVEEPLVRELIGSSGIHPETGAAVNLGPRAMSKIWGDAKNKLDDSAEALNHLKLMSKLRSKVRGYDDQFEQREHRSLLAWCKQGFDNPQAGNPEDPGISLREIACRVGTFVYENLRDAGPTDSIVAYGHSGDIEPFVYLCLEMMDGKDCSNEDAMVKRFQETGGALEPLGGTGFHFHSSGTLYFGVPLGCEVRDLKEIGLEILQEQANWLKQYGKSQEVLEQRLKLGK